MSHVNYPNNNTPDNLEKPNYSNQNEYKAGAKKGDRDYHGNDNKTAHYPNSNRTGDGDKKPPNSNLEQQ